jgi:PAS domain S-box-containing protein
MRAVMPTIPAPGETAASNIDDDCRELALFRAVLDAMDEAVLVTGPDLELPGPTIQYVNPALLRMTGYSAEELLGQTPRIFQGEATKRAVLDAMIEALSADRRFCGEVVNYNKDGSEYVVEWLILPIRNEDGEVVHWVSVQRDVTQRRKLEARQVSLIGELNHRVKNTLSTVQSIAVLTLRSTPSPEVFAENFQARLLALSQAHNLLTRSDWMGAPLRECLSRELTPYCGDDLGRCTSQGEEVWLPPRIALALTMAFHELASNAARHGALSAAAGNVQVGWSIATTPSGRLLSIQWTERNGPPVPAERARSGFGSRYLERGLAHELQGTVQLRFEPDGVSCSIDVLLPAQALH